MEKDSLWSPEFLCMSGSNLIFFMSQYILVASLPIFIMDYLGGNEVQAGLAMTAFQIGTVFCRPFAGRLIDTLNKKSIMIFSTLAFFLVMVAFGFVHSLNSILALRLVHGILFALGTTASATLAVLVLPRNRKGEGIGYFSVTNNIAMVIGPLVGLLLIQYMGARGLFIFTSLMGLLAVLVGNIRKLPQDIVIPAKKKQAGIHWSDFVEASALPYALLGGLVFFAYGGVLTYIPMYMKSLHLGSYTSIFFMTFASVIVLTRPLIGYLFDHHGADWTVYPGFFFFISGFFFFSGVHGVISLIISAAVLGVGFGALSPAFQTLAVREAPASRAGVATSTYFWSLDISVGLAAVLLGMVVQSVGYSVTFGIICTGVVCLAVAYYIYRTRFLKKK